MAQVTHRSIGLIFLLVVPSAAFAHPMGNFTINHTSILELTGNRLIQHALVDYAEVPSFGQFSIIDTNGDRVVTPKELKGYLDRLVPTIASQYVFKADGKPFPFRLIRYTPRLYPGVVRVTCLQILIWRETVLPKKNAKLKVQFENHVYADQIGKSNVRLLWSPEWKVDGVEAVPTRGLQTVGQVTDFQDSLLLEDTRDVRFVIRRIQHPTGSYEPLRPGFLSVDPYLSFQLLPQSALTPDAQGRYKIFHVKLAQNIVVARPAAVTQAQPLEETPNSPSETITEATTRVSRSSVPAQPRPGSVRKLGRAEQKSSAPTRHSLRLSNNPATTKKLGRAEQKFSELIHTKNVGPSALLTMILLSMVYGATHALSPGHGKTIVAAYLVGTQGNLWKGIIQAIYLGIIVTLSHVFVVLVIGILAMTLTAGALSARVTILLQIASGLLVMAIGIPMIIRRTRTYFLAKVEAAGVRAHSFPHEHSRHHDPAHSHSHESSHEGYSPHDAHSHNHPHSHPHVHFEHSHHGHDPHSIPADASWWDLLVLGVTGGMAPCLGAVLVFLIGAGYGRLALGMTLIVAFSVGLAAVLIAIGITMVLCKQLLDRVFDGLDARFGRTEGSARAFFQFGTPIIAAVLITLVGAAICIRALIQGGYLVIHI